MKLKEELAHDYLKEVIENDPSGQACDEDIETAYLKGFNDALQMITKSLSEGLISTEEDILFFGEEGFDNEA